MSLLLKNLLGRLQGPAGDDGSDTSGAGTGDAGDAGGAQDRGDDFTPTDDDATGGDAGTAQGGDGDDGAGDGAAAGGAGSDADDDGQGDRSDQRIPKGRFNEVNERRKALETENQQLRRELEEARKGKAPAAAPAPAQASAAPAASPAAAPAPAAVVAFDPDAKEQEYIEALMAGDTGKAAKIRREINAHIVSEASAKAESTVSRREATKLLNEEVAATLQAHPWLDTEDGADALELIQAARDSAIAKGVPPYKALRDAVAKIAPRFAPAGSRTPAGELPGAGGQGDTRTANAIKRGAADSEAQPALVQSGIGNRATAGRVNVAQLDEEQFANLSEAEKRRLRGD